MSREPYPTWWNQTITIYNKFMDEDTHIIKWYRHKVDRCFWRDTNDFISNVITCRIPTNPLFLERYEWVDLSEKDKETYFTIGPGDFIVRGSVDEEIDEGAKGHRASDFIYKYKQLQGCMEVNIIQLNTTGGRNNEHYFVKGS